VSLGDLVAIIWRIPGVSSAIVFGVVAAVVVGRWWARRFGGSAMMATAVLASWAVLVTVTLVPDTTLAWQQDTLAFVGRTAAGNVAVCVTSWGSAVSQAVTTLDGQANILLFAVPALLGAFWLRRPVIVGLALTAQSALTELFQAVIAGPACQTSDWIANSVGAALGVAIAAGAIAVAGRFSAGRRVASTAPVARERR
jgi:hypothetical protein